MLFRYELLYVRPQTLLHITDGAAVFRYAAT